VWRLSWDGSNDDEDSSGETGSKKVPPRRLQRSKKRKKNARGRPSARKTMGGPRLRRDTFSRVPPDDNWMRHPSWDDGSNDDDENYGGGAREKATGSSRAFARDASSSSKVGFSNIFADNWMHAHEFKSAFRACSLEWAQRGTFSTGRPRLVIWALDSAGVCLAQRFAMEIDSKFKTGQKCLFVSRTELGNAAEYAYESMGVTATTNIVSSVPWAYIADGARSQRLRSRRLQCAKEVREANSDFSPYPCPCCKGGKWVTHGQRVSGRIYQCHSCLQGLEKNSLYTIVGVERDGRRRMCCCR
jgi:hypothetical protein